MRSASGRRGDTGADRRWRFGAAAGRSFTVLALLAAIALPPGRSDRSPAERPVRKGIGAPAVTIWRMVSFDPAGLALVALLLALYGRATTVLRWRGYRVPGSQQALWYSGVALLAIALLGPPDALSDDLLSAHMAQHLLLADLSAPLLLAGA